jgi:ABC-type spermidine/putrescine transport system permease subunit I
MSSRSYAGIDRLRSVVGGDTSSLVLLLPLVVAFTALFIVPVGQLFSRAFLVDGTISLANFREIFSTGLYIDVIVRTVRISALTTAITMVSGYLLAYYIVFRSSNKRLLLLLVFVTMMVDLVIRIFGWVVAFSSGSILEILTSPFVEDFSILFSETAIVIGLVQFTLPFMIFVTVGVLSNIDDSLVEAARDLGATRAQAFLRLTLPLSMNAIIVGGSLVFALSMSSFVSPQLLGGGRNRMIANTIFSLIGNSGEWGIAAALGFTLLVTTASILVIFIAIVTALLGSDRP